MFVHSAVAVNNLGLDQVDFLRGLSLEDKLENMRHVNNLGRSAGAAWGVGDVMRWAENIVSGFEQCLLVELMTYTRTRTTQARSKSRVSP